MTAKIEGNEEDVALTSAATKRMRVTSDSCQLAATAGQRLKSRERGRMDESRLPVRTVESRVASVYFARTPLRHVSKNTTKTKTHQTNLTNITNITNHTKQNKPNTPNKPNKPKQPNTPKQAQTHLNKPQHNTTQHNTTHDRQDRTGQDRTGKDRTGQDTTGQDRTGQDRTGLWTDTCVLKMRPHHNHHKHHKAQTGGALLFVLVTSRSSPVVDMVLRGDNGSSWRRRQRRLRSWWRHEQQSVAMALSAAAHHSYDKVAAGAKYDGLRAQTTDRAEEAANKAPQRQRSNAAEDAMFFELFDEDTAGARPEAFAEPRPQERVQRHVVEHITDLVRVAPMVQILDAPVSQMVDNVMDTFRCLDKPIAEQVIGVPKISGLSCPSRASLREPQMAEHLMEVPTIVSYSFLQQLSVEQPVDIPVPHGGFACGGPQDFPPGHGPLKRTAEEISDILGFYGDLQGFHTRQGSKAQNVHIPVPGGVPEDTHVPGSIEWVQLGDGDTSKTYYWNRRTQATVWKPPLGSARRPQVERYTTGTKTPAPVVLLSLLCLLGDAPHPFLGATPRAHCLWQSVRCRGDA